MRLKMSSAQMVAILSKGDELMVLLADAYMCQLAWMSW